MAWLRKPKSGASATPLLCHVCHKNLGTIRLDTLPASARAALGNDAVDDNAWVCATCAQQFGRDDRQSS